METTKRAILLFILSVVTFAIQAGPKDFRFVLYNAENNFDGEYIYSLLQDDKGFLWIGSDDGLYRFDGMEMLKLNKEDTVKSIVTASTISSEGYVYIGYIQGGISVVEHGRYRKLLSTDELPNRVEQLKVDDSGVLWGLTRNQGLVRIERGAHEKFQLPIFNELISNDFITIKNKLFVATSDGLEVFTIEDNDLEHSGSIQGLEGINTTALYLDKDNNNLLWVGTEEGMYRYYFDSNRLQNVSEFPNDFRVSSINKDDLNTLWVGTYNNGLVEMDLQKDEVYTLTHFNVSSGFESNEIGKVFIDKENEVWVGTFGRGLVQLNRKYFNHYELFKTIDVQGVRSVANYQEDQLLLATDNGIIRVFKKTMRDSLVFEKLSYSEDYSFTSLAVLGKEVWAGTQNNGVLKIDLEAGNIKKVFLNPLDPVNAYLIRDIQLDAKNNIWVSAAANGVYHLTREGELINHYNTRNGFYHNEIFSIYPDRAGNVWFGSHAVGLAVLRNNGEMEFLTRDKIFPAYDINSIIQDDSGKIWIATAGSGVYSFDGESFKQFSTEDGMLSKFCNAVMVDDIGNVWVGHRLGLSLIQPEFEVVRTFNHPSELGETESELNSVSKDAEGNVYFGNPFGITKINIPHFFFDLSKRESHIKDIRLYYQNVDLLQFSESGKVNDILPSDLTFEYNDNHLSFDFVSINLRNPEAMFYQYTLEGYDKTWSMVGKTNKATYTNLDPGTYTFKVKESDHSELWNDTDYTSITFTIAPPYWRTWWFYLMQLGVYLFIMYLTLTLSSRFKSQFLTRLMVYVSLFILFEYIHTEVEPYMERITGEIPIFQVGTNLLLALILLPVEFRLSAFLERRASRQQKIDSAMDKITKSNTN